MKDVGVIAEIESLKKTICSSASILQVEEKEQLSLLDMACNTAFDFSLPDRSHGSMCIVTSNQMLEEAIEPAEVTQRPLLASFSQAHLSLNTCNWSNGVIDFSAAFKQTKAASERATITTEALA
jgi:hypothetical protein